MLQRLKAAYQDRMLPRVINCACNVGACSEQREMIVPGASGDVLEIGFGSGLNLPFYQSKKIRRLWALEPAAAMWKLAAGRLRQCEFPVAWIAQPAEQLDLPDNSIDTVVMTYTLCTVANPAAALREMRRVLRPHGRMLFCEHGVDFSDRVRRWQNRLDPVWSCLFGGCHLNRDIPQLIRDSEFQIASLWTGNVADLRVVSFTYRGEAVPE